MRSDSLSLPSSFPPPSSPVDTSFGANKAAEGQGRSPLVASWGAQGDAGPRCCRYPAPCPGTALLPGLLGASSSAHPRALAKPLPWVGPWFGQHTALTSAAQITQRCRGPSESPQDSSACHRAHRWYQANHTLNQQSYSHP